MHPLCEFFPLWCIFLLNCLLPLSPCSRVPSSILVTPSSPQSHGALFSNARCNLPSMGSLRRLLSALPLYSSKMPRRAITLTFLCPSSREPLAPFLSFVPLVRTRRKSQSTRDDRRMPFE